MSIWIRAKVRSLDIRQPSLLEARRLLERSESPELAIPPYVLLQTESADRLIVPVPYTRSRTKAVPAKEQSPSWNGFSFTPFDTVLAIKLQILFTSYQRLTFSRGCEVAEKDCRNRSLWVSLWARIFQSGCRYCGSVGRTQTKVNATQFIPCKT